MSLFSGIGKFLKKIWSFIKKILPLLIIIIFVFAPYIGPWLTGLGLTTLGGFVTAIGAGLAGLGFWGSLAVGLGVSAILFPGETSELVAKVADVVGDVVNAAGNIVADGLTGFISDVVFSPIGLLAIGFGLWILLKDDSQQQPQKDTSKLAVESSSLTFSPTSQSWKDLNAR